MGCRILYIIDERGLDGGAHVATERLLAVLKKRGYNIDVMEAIRRDSFWGVVHRAYARIISILHLHLSPSPLFLRDPFGFRFRKMKSYDTVCVMSEESPFTPIVARLPPSVRKVQLIHTNYPMWAERVKRNVISDANAFAKFDCIGCIGLIGARDFERVVPACKGKVLPFHNIIEIGLAEKMHRMDVQGPLRILTLGRFDDKLSKDGPRIIRVVERLRKLGFKFDWTSYGGGGNGLAACIEESKRIGVDDVLHIYPYNPDALAKVREFDIFVLLSHYEGLPNVIYESMSLGLPVFATRVGGIPEQVQDGVNGWLVEDDEDLIVGRLSAVLSDRQDIVAKKNRVSNYVYDNDKVVNEHLRILLNSW